MDAGSVSELAIAGTDDTGLWVSVPDRLDAAGTDIEHWHCSARVLGLGGFAGTTGVAQLWVDALREFVDAVEVLIAGDESGADLDLEMAQASVILARDGRLRVDVEMEEPGSDSSVSCTCTTTVDYLAETLAQARVLLGRAAV